MRQSVVGGFLLGAMVASASVAQTATPRTLVEDMRIDGAEHEFSFINGIVPLRNGNIVVFQSGDFWGTIFSSSGAEIRKFARKGAGPGEVQRLTSFGLLGDSIWVTDRGQNRITLFSADAAVGRSVQVSESPDWSKLRPGATSAFAGVVMPRVLLPGDVGLGMPGTLAQALSSGAVTSIPMVRTSWNGSGARVVAELPTRSSTIEIRTKDATTYFAQPFRSSPWLEPSKDGRRIVYAEAVEAPQPVIRIVHLSSMGDTLSRQEISYVPIPLTRKTVDSVVKGMITDLKMADNEAAVRAAVNAPKFYYPFDKLLAGNDGSVWLRGPIVDGRRTWTIVPGAGKAIETITLPASTDLHWIDGAIWGVVRDADDVPSVVRFRRK